MVIFKFVITVGKGIILKVLNQFTHPLIQTIFKLSLLVSFYFLISEFIMVQAESFEISTKLGKEIVNSARDSVGFGSTTFNRKEQKSVVHKDLFDQMLLELKSENINLLQRDRSDFGKKNSTFTIYSHAAKFLQGRVKTSIRLRSRFYVNQFQPYTPSKRGQNKNYVVDDHLYKELCGLCTIINTSRSEITRDSGFLEIKIKNPSEEEEYSVLKIRMLVEDHLLRRLYNVDPDNELEFNDFLDELSVNLAERNKEAHVRSIINVIRILAKIHRGFIRPEFAVSYQRNAFDFTDESNRVYEEGLQKPKFQITIDANIRYHRINRFGNFLDIVSYYENDINLVGVYPESALALEFKDPVRDPVDKRTKTHQKLLDTFVTKAQMKKHVFHGFKPNKGKAANYKNMVTFKNRFQSCNWEESF